MKTLRLLEKNWSYFIGHARNRVDPLSSDEYHQIIEKAQSKILQSLFEEVPNLNCFTIVQSWDIILLDSINLVKSPWSYTEGSDFFKSWLVEVNLKEGELGLLKKVVETLSDQKLAYFRNDYKDFHED